MATSEDIEGYTLAVESQTYLEGADIAVVAIYFALVIAIGVYASCRAKQGSVGAYFLAGRKMTFLTVGASLFVSNIGTEHLTGLAGSGAKAGIGVGAFECNAIVVLQLLGFVFLPVYLANKICTMPEYLYRRFGGQRIRVYYAILSLILYIFTKCSVVLYTGALFVQQSLGWDLYLSMVILLAIVAVLTITGGLTAVMYTDTFQALLVITGALVLTLLGFQKVDGFDGLWRKYPHAVTNETVENETCHEITEYWDRMLRPSGDNDIPWTGLLLGQTWGSIWYWCTDQVIVQRGLAAKSLSHAQGGTILAGFAKVLPLFTMVMPGMISRVLYPREVGCVDPERCQIYCQSSAGCSSIAFPKLVLGILPTGLRGLMMAVMIAALMSDLDSIFNSASSLFTIDIYKRFRKTASVREQMIAGRLFIVVLVGVAIAWVPMVKEAQGGQIFLYINEVINYLAPPVGCVFLLAVLWRRCNEKGAFCGLMAGFVVGVTRLILVFVYPGADACGKEDKRPPILAKVHFMHFGIILFVITCFVTVIVSLVTEKPDARHLVRTTFWTRHDRNGDVTKDENIEINSDLDDGNKSQAVEFSFSNQLKSPDSSERMPAISSDVENDTTRETTATTDHSIIVKFLLRWACGYTSDADTYELGTAEDNSLSGEDLLKQGRTAKIVLYVMLVIVLLVGTFMLCFWSLWHYTP